jgi:hypothetical protein
MRSFHGASEFGAAALGQLGGGMLSPESWIGLGAKGASWLWRVGKAGLQQGAINAATDPVVQGLNIKAGAQEQYDPWRTAIAGGTGFLTGTTAKSLAEGPTRLGARPRSFVSSETKLQSTLKAIDDYRSENILRDLFRPEEGTVTVHPESGKFGVNSDSAMYIANDRRAANRLRDQLIRSDPALPRGSNIGQRPMTLCITRKRSCC